MKKFIIKASFFAPLLILLIVFNYVVDPQGQFKNRDKVRKVADALDAGFGVTNFKLNNFDDRTLLKIRIGSLKTRLDIAVFGSSRVMLISSDMFPGKSFLNNGLSSNALQDEINLYQIYKERGMLPATIIIGVDPWIFNKNNGLFLWHEYGQYYRQFIKSEFGRPLDFRAPDLIPYKWQMLLSTDYFLAGLESLKAVHLHDYELTQHRLNLEETIFPDGSRTWGQNLRERSPVDVKNLIITDNSHPFDPQGFIELDKDLQKQFVKFVEVMQKDGVNVEFYLPPYNPLSYDTYIHPRQIKLIKEVELFVRNTAASHGLSCVGSYDPHQLSIPESLFMDEYHLRSVDELRSIFSSSPQLRTGIH